MLLRKKYAIAVVIAFMFFCFFKPCDLLAQAKRYRLTSPDKTLIIEVNTGEKTQWAVWKGNDQALLPSDINIELSTGEMLGVNTKVLKSITHKIDQSFPTPFYKKSTVNDNCNELTLFFSGNYSLVFRAYNDGVAYRFETNRKGQLTIHSEKASFHFGRDHSGFFAMNTHNPISGDPYSSYFESLYSKFTLSRFPKDTLAFLPALIQLEEGRKLAILESGLENYPGMFLHPDKDSSSILQGSFAPYPRKEGLFRNMMDIKVEAREDFIAKVDGKNKFPWRALLVSASDKELLDNDMALKLAAPSRIEDESWIRPGKVAWDWWSDMNISHVDFKAGVNTETYKYYIDFAANNKLEYIIMDEGWSSDTNLLDVSSAISLDSIIGYGRKRDVGVLLWATIYAAAKNTDSLFAHYSKIGVKGFKIDFIDRDDQQMVRRLYELAASAAKNKLVIDLHGMFKPSGMQRTYPNLLNFEGVRGLEWYKGSDETSIPIYDVQIPFIRMLSGPMDYTPGAMRNASKSNFRAVSSMPMSLGTRCHQLAMYVVYEAPLQMLADNPTAYQRDTACTQFIASFPTVFDETVAVDGSLGEFAIIARRKGSDWYIGALNNWTSRDIDIPVDFIGNGVFEAEIFSDGLNAERDGTDYARNTMPIKKDSSLHLHLAAGGGWASILRKK